MVRALLAPRMLALHAMAVVVTAAAVLLGLWQYGVWQNGREDRTTAVVDARPVALGSVMTSDQPFPAGDVGRPVSLAGRWVPRGTIYVSGRQLHGRTGVWAVTPVAVCDGAAATCARAPAMLVVRGWAASVHAAPAPPTGRVQVTGWLQPGEGAGNPDPKPGDDVFPDLQVTDALQRVHQDLYSGYVIARTTSPTSEGLAAVTPGALPRASAFTSLRNLLYAVEWWFFGGFAVYVWGRWCRDEVSRVTGVPSRA